MKTPVRLALAIVGILVASPFALPASAQSETTQTGATLLSAFGQARTPGQGLCPPDCGSFVSFSAQSGYDFFGFTDNSVSVYGGSFPNYWDLSCRGPEFADAIRVNQGTGVVEVEAVLDPASPSCFSFMGPTVTAPIHISLRGRPAPFGDSRAFHDSKNSTGRVRSTQWGTAFDATYLEQTDTFGEIFSGVIGSAALELSGSALRSHRNIIRREP